jgi:peptidoglycan hydrolase-like protein with peptidoglycan-binding domain
MLRERKRSLVRAFVTPKVLNGAPAVQHDDTLQMGDTGSDVTVLQKLLFGLNFNITVDGNFSQGTVDAVKSFQQKNNLPVTGIATPEVIGAIQEEASLPNVAGKKLTTGSYLRRGDGGDGVIAIQKALNANGAKPALGVDGVFGNGTVAAVKAFQKQQNLDVDGVVGPATFQALGIMDA